MSKKFIGTSTVGKKVAGYQEKPIVGKRGATAGSGAWWTAANSGLQGLNNAIKQQKFKNNLLTASKIAYTGIAKKNNAKGVSYGNANNYYNGSSALSNTNGSGNPFSDWSYLEYLSDRNTAVNIAMNRENNNFAAEQAKIQRNWEAEMSNTAHQREVADLKAAGLNPILSANAGAAVPSGASAGASNFNGADTSYVNALAGILESTLQANATMTAASMNAAASMYGADANLKGNIYSADKQYGANIYATNKQSIYGLIGDVLRLAGSIGGAVAGYKGITKAAATEHRSATRSVSHSVSRNYNWNSNV